MSITNEGDGLANPAMRIIRAWDRFWFTPADPTILGMIRICCGLVVFYVHLAYSYDLQTFFGKDAWLNLDMVNNARLQTPWVGPPTGWQPLDPQAGHTPDELTPEQQAFILRWGVHPDHVMAWGQPLWSIYFDVTDPTWMWVAHSCILTSIFLFTIGFCTRITSVLTWVGMLCYIQRAPTTLFGMDTIMIVVVLYLMIGPSGAALSVDRLIARYWIIRKALRNHLPVPKFAPPAPQVSANVALRLLQVHLCIIYAASGLSKLQGAAWWNGWAVWGTMANYEFSPMGLRIYIAFLQFICQHRWLCELVTTGGSYFTLAFEIFFLPCAVFTWLLELETLKLQGIAPGPGGRSDSAIKVITRLNHILRGIMVVSAVLLHTGIALFMGLVTFSLMMLVGVLAFIPAAAVRERLSRLAIAGGWIQG
jgi:hypothetical protein